MGSLPQEFSERLQPQTINSTKLHQLFETQRRIINYFFENLDFSQARSFSEALLNTHGTIFFTGIGKSGFVAQKVAQTLVSLGIRSGFLSATDALHGDIGIMGKGDTLVLFSKSGNTEELLRLVPCVKAKGVFLMGAFSSKDCLLSRECDLWVYLPLERELCPFDLAPVTSTAIQMVFGDTVAIALMGAKNLTRDEYAANHPAGRIGKCLIFKVKDLMRKQEQLPICKEGDLIMDQLAELTSKGCGCLLVVDNKHRLIGTFTDGDLRRTLKASKEGTFHLTVGEVCNRSPRTIGPNSMAVEAMQKMEAPPSPVQFLPVVDDQNVVIGIVTLHGLVSAGL
ncbi:hypothetical protein AMTRI_Chr07g75130 [Amborella trichopoda]|uniref:SIS domain-containing protein n=1 Tax=Amborella trichopoda TaxID=13333 RepID=U5D960_AMBTC|nr:probable arabinose 5-phosphate isomerase [Amborella trichopoda]ERN18765.1 hypothetical protein AMTR_s00067p00050020 [Amborella trichopoda]|eukprot:XP_006857298.1 probable arabinose 5-phosphate isomerase [Amborella trichopoda]